MTDASSPRPGGTRRWIRLLIAAVLAAPVGYVVGMGLARVFPDAGPLEALIGGLRWSDAVAAVLALVMTISAAVVFIFSLNPVRAARLLVLPEAATPDEIGLLRCQGVICLLSAVVLVLPLALPAGGLSPIIALGLIVALLALHTVLNLGFYRDSDEMLRAVTTEAAMKTFWIGQGVLFLWAAAERLGVAPVLTAWDVYVVLMGLYLAIAAVVTARRGLA